MEKIKQNKNGVILLVALIVLTIVFFATKKPKDDVIVNEDVMTDGTVEGDSTSAITEIPMPAESSWVPNEVSEDKLTLDIPTEYFVSKPRIDDCDVTSISTVRDNGKPVSVALVYNVGCTNADLLSNASKSVEKNGYVFRTNYTSPSVIAVYERLVQSAR